MQRSRTRRDGPWELAPAVGLEPTTKRLTAARSTTELRRSEDRQRRSAGRPRAGPRRPKDSTGRADSALAGLPYSSMHAISAMSLISPEELAARIDDAGPADRRRPLVPGQAGRRPGGVRRGPPARRDLPRPRRATSAARRGPRPPSPPRPGRLRRAPRPAPGSATATWSWPTTTSAAGSPRGCGGCSTTSATRGSAVLDGGLAGLDRAAACRRRPMSPTLEPAELHLADALVADRRPGRPARAPARLAPAGRPRRAGGPALPRRGRADRPGRRPHPDGAVSAPTDGNLGPDGRFLSPSALRERFDALGADGGDVVTSCGSGVSACHNALAMRIAGLPDPILYPGSWSDWSTAGYPAARRPGAGPTARSEPASNASGEWLGPRSGHAFEGTDRRSGHAARQPRWSETSVGSSARPEWSTA